MKRRSFLKVVGGTVGSGAVAGQTALGEPAAGLPRRVLGRTGKKISVVAFPGLCLIHGEQEQCNAAVKKAFEQGINYFDVAPAYGNMKAERRMGIALEGVDRSKIFLSNKTDKRDKEGAREELERSLKLLKTDHFDLYQLHALIKPDEVKKALGPGGAMETILEAKKEGKIRYIGFSAHTTKAALEAMNGFQFDSVMFPISFVEYFGRGFGKPVLELAKKQGAGVLAIKAMYRGLWPQGMKRTRRWWYRAVETPEEVSMALNFALAQPNVASIFSPAWFDLTEKAMVAARSIRPLTDAEAAKLKEIARGCEYFFKREEAKAAWGGHRHDPLYPTCPHGCGDADAHA